MPANSAHVKKKWNILAFQNNLDELLDVQIYSLTSVNFNLIKFPRNNSENFSLLYYSYLPYI